MGTFTDPAKMLAHMRKRTAVAVKGMESFAEFSAKEGYWKDMRPNLAGRVSSEELRRAGHPYGRGQNAKENYTNAGNVLKRGKVPRLPINRQSGRLAMSLRLRRAGRSVWDLGIGTAVPYARFILHPAGTKKMVGRGLMGWRKVNASYPAGLVERRQRLRTAAARDALRRSHKKLP